MNDHSPAPVYVKRNLFGGKGDVLIWDLLGAARLAPFKAVLACELAPGGTVGVHLQEAFPELVIVTGGTGTMSVNGVERGVAPGSLVLLPLGATLAISNSDPVEPLNYLIIKAGNT
jgi:mannose-6-phosphate isomerase-like protein (cupin superfamily)